MLTEVKNKKKKPSVWKLICLCENVSPKRNLLSYFISFTFMNLIFYYSISVCTDMTIDQMAACYRIKSNIFKTVIPTSLSGIWYIRILSHVIFDKFFLSQVIGAVAMLVNLIIYKLTCTEFGGHGHSGANLMIWAIAASISLIIYIFVLIHKFLKFIDTKITERRFQKNGYQKFASLCEGK